MTPAMRKFLASKQRNNTESDYKPMSVAVMPERTGAEMPSDAGDIQYARHLARQRQTRYAIHETGN